MIQVLRINKDNTTTQFKIWVVYSMEYYKDDTPAEAIEDEGVQEDWPSRYTESDAGDTAQRTYFTHGERS